MRVRQTSSSIFPVISDLLQANEAATYVEELAGESANIIFGAMYDESEADTAKITVIATGLEEQASAGQDTGYAKKAERPGFTGSASTAFRSQTAAQPTFSPRRESTLQIPSFLQKK